MTQSNTQLERLQRLAELLEGKMSPDSCESAKAIVRELIEDAAKEATTTNSDDPYNLKRISARYCLTHREVEVLEQILDGASNKIAGRTLGISPRTIEDHRANIMKKLGAKNIGGVLSIVMGWVIRGGSDIPEEHRAHAA